MSLSAKDRFSRPCDTVVFGAQVATDTGPLISLTLNGSDGHPLAIIVDNEWIGGDLRTWILNADINGSRSESENKNSHLK